MQRNRNDAPFDQAILIVEQNAPTRELYIRELSRHYRVFACCDEGEALGLIDRHDISAVVLEPEQPDGRGWALLAALKHTREHIPVILCSTLDERKRGLGLGASAYLIKPVLPTTLLEAVRRIIDKVIQ